MELREIAPHVHACLQEDRGWGFSNAGFVDMGGGLVVDTFFDLGHTREMIRLCAGVSTEPARRLVNTHHNGDHCWGNQLFSGAEIIGHRLCAEAMGKDLSPAAAAAMLSAPDLPPGLRWFADDVKEFDFSGIDLTPPTTLIDDRLDLDLDGSPAHVLYVGPAHTPGDVIVHLPEQGVVFGGDVLWNRCTPIGWEGTTEQWLAALDVVIGLEPKVVVPGHGPLCDLDAVRELRRYFEFVRDEAKPHFDAGLSALDAAKKIELGPFGRWNQPERLVFNVERAYRELRGDAWDAPVDAVELLEQAWKLREHYAGR